MEMVRIVKENLKKMTHEMQEGKNLKRLPLLLNSLI